jgi:RNA polymerase sigma factor (sigma-70 family)
LSEVHQGFQQLGECLLPVARQQLNPNQYDWHDVEECVQNALRDIWTSMKRGNGPQGPASFFAFAVTVVQRRCWDKIRYTERRPSEPLITDTGEETQQVASAAKNRPEQLPGYLFLRVERLIRLIAMVHTHANLSPKSQTILIHGFLFERTDVELAQSLLVTKDNIRLTRHRNLEQLRKDNAFLTDLRNLYTE